MIQIFLNGFSWIFAIGATALSVYFINDKKNQQLQSNREENNREFRSLQKQFLFPCLTVLFTESIQVPYLYVLFFYYHYGPMQIGALYIVGLISNVFFKFYSLHLLSRYGRRFLCLLCIFTGSLACTLKPFSSFAVLTLSRLFDGAFAALISSPFQQWYTHQHLVTYDFPVEWMTSTFYIVAIGTGFLSICAGFFTHFVVTISHYDALPFVMSPILYILAALFIIKQWPENKAIDAPIPMTSVMKKALGHLRSSPISLVICVVSCFVDTASQLFIFVWAPLFMKYRSGDYFSFGIIYSCLIASHLLGLVFQSSEFTRKISNSRLLLGSTIIGMIALYIGYSQLPLPLSRWQHDDAPYVLMAFLVFEFAMGMANPSMDALQSSFIPGPQRPALSSLSSVPITLLVSSVIWALFPSSLGGEQKIILATVM
ncbi:hypothetical protein WR25_24394 isoform D [Diploscapter pachys]|uniref:Molybdate-anion transporter n=1 Tax=Diploscapter pachys TaxID=2018661 RepID=A0A2A2LTJ1_9BILA|nr:hypothetical protein WR25_24394 isoform D [Diploscapter pachys]